MMLYFLFKFKNLSNFKFQKYYKYFVINNYLNYIYQDKYLIYNICFFDKKKSIKYSDCI